MGVHCSLMSIEKTIRSWRYGEGERINVDKERKQRSGLGRQDVHTLLGDK